jgi:methyl-accepting chemotaxis protein
LKKKISIGWKIGFIAVVGFVAANMAGALYSTYIYKQLVRTEFEERIVNIGQNIARTVIPVIDDLESLRPGEKSRRERAEFEKQIKFLLNSAAAGKDIYFTAVLRGRGAVYTGTYNKDEKFTLPKIEKEASQRYIHKFKLYKVDVEGKDAYEMVMSYGEMDIIVGFDMEGINSSASSAGNKVFIVLIIGTLAVAAMLLLYIFFGVIRPISMISAVSERISTGDISEKVKILKTGDEIEVLTKSFRDMSEYINLIAWISESVSNGELVEAFEPKSEKDILGKAFVKMLIYINDFAAVLGRVAKGDLTNAMVCKSDKDTLGTACVDMTASLKALVSHIKDQADFLSLSSKQLEEISKQGQTTIQQLAETIANISQATSDAAKNSQTASQASVRAEQSAKQGTEKMNELLAKMNSLSSEIGQSSISMQKLEAHSEEIKNMTAVIKAIADETKLLSFNAAIEAARAGEAGRGFVVVAEEIRKLSELSTQQAAKISERIKEVRADIAGAVEIAGRESDSIKISSRLTQETNSIFIDIVKSIDETASHMESIAATSQQIAASSQEAAAASQEQSSSMEELNAVVSEFSDTAKTLKAATDKFTI